jgi:hypothetical protein
VFGDGVFKEVTEGQWGHNVALIPQDWVLKEEDMRTQMQTEGRPCEDSEETTAAGQGQRG